MTRVVAFLTIGTLAYACSDATTSGPAGNDAGDAGEDAAPAQDAAVLPDAGARDVELDADSTDAEHADTGFDAGTPSDTAHDAAGPDRGEDGDAGSLDTGWDDGGSDGHVSEDAGTSDTGFDDAGAADSGTDDSGFSWTGTFDIGRIRDQMTAECTFSNHRTTVKDGVSVDVWDVSYYSWESVSGDLKPILIRAFASKPVSADGNLPGVVQAHGLGGFAEENHATGLAALLSMFTIAYTGPGGGTAPENTSEGLPASHNNGYRMFDTVPDLRGSWFWAHAVAAMRALTCLESRPEVDKSRLGMTGFSAGSVVTLISSGADNRIKASVPLSGTGAWDVATQSPQAWQHKLLSQAGLSTASPEWQNLMAGLITPALMVGNAKAMVLMVNGSTDEFFPLTAHMATYDAIPGVDKKTSIAANFDHGCYSVSGVESAKDIEDRASIRSAGGQRMWFSHWFGTDAKYAYVPAAPVVSVTPAGAATFFAAAVDSGGPDLEVEEVRAWASNDDSFVYASAVLDESGGVYQKLVPFTMQANTIYFVDVQYKTKSLLLPERFSISSAPVIPAGLVPHIRSMDNCL
ncbi:MAG: acetylxylan esterase [Deltaproteobacteria bacterium]|nr:acetylxylan esterase [Deltaproteobacteria bacterium]